MATDETRRPGMRDEHLNLLDIAIRRVNHMAADATEESRAGRGGLSAVRSLDQLLAGLVMARELYTRPGQPERYIGDVLEEALTGPLLTDGPRLQGQIELERNRDNPQNFNLITSRTPYAGGGWTLSSSTEFSPADLIELGRAVRRAIVNGQLGPAS